MYRQLAKANCEYRPILPHHQLYTLQSHINIFTLITLLIYIINNVLAIPLVTSERHLEINESI